MDHDTYSLSHLEPSLFQRLAITVARALLGPGVQSFAPGPDGGRDGWFRGTAQYPTAAENWSGIWYVQAKHCSLRPGTKPQEWIQTQLESELERFADPSSDRVWPDNWIIVSNIEITAGRRGTLDKLLGIIEAVHPPLAKRTHFWGPSHIIDIVDRVDEVRARYGHFLTPGHVLTKVYEQLTAQYPEFDTLVRSLVLNDFRANERAKLDQAGSVDDAPALHALFVDLPYRAKSAAEDACALKELAATSADNHQGATDPLADCRPERTPIWLIKAGPGHGKSTIGQFFAQVHRAAIVETLGDGNQFVASLSSQVLQVADRLGVRPTHPRIPIIVELKSYAAWLSEREKDDARGVLTYLTVQLSKKVQQTVSVGLLREWLKRSRWFIAFDGLDEVPHEVREEAAGEIAAFFDEFHTRSDLLAICTTRPQGYSGQFDRLPGAAHIELMPLSPEHALECASRILAHGKATTDAEAAVAILKAALKSTAMQSLMSTPLHAHIIALLVRGGVHPPEQKWELFSAFYDVTYKRELAKNLKSYEVLSEQKNLIRVIHNRLGFVLHARAEAEAGATASLPMAEFKALAIDAARGKLDVRVDEVAGAICAVATQRLLLISTPDDGAFVRFDIRQLQEFFAGSFVSDSYDVETGETDSIRILAGDAHWREPVLFAISAFISKKQRNAIRRSVLALQSLENADSVDERTVRAAIALGPRLLFALARDGVLESERLVRSEFSNLCKTMFSTMSLALPFPTVRGEQTRSWLINIALQCLDSHLNSWSHARAAVVVGQLLSDGDARVGPYLERLRDDRELRCFVMLNVTSRIPPQRWHAVETARLLIEEGLAVNKLARLAMPMTGRRRAKGELEQWTEWVATHLSAQQALLLRQFVGLTSSAAEFDGSSDEKLPTFFEAIRRLVLYRRERSGQSLRAWWLAVGRSWRAVQSMANGGQSDAIIPVSDNDNYQDESLFSLSPAEYREAFSRVERSDFAEWRATNSHSLSMESIRFAPEYAIRNLATLEDFAEEDYDLVLEWRRRIIGAVIATPALAVACQPSIWASLITAATPPQADELRGILNAAAMVPETFFDWFEQQSIRPYGFEPFEVDRAEAGLMAVIAIGVIAERAGRNRNFYRGEVPDHGDGLPSVEILEAVVADSLHPSHIRASAVLLLLLRGVPQPERTLAAYGEVLEQAMNEGREVVSTAIATVIDDLQLADSDAGRRLIARGLSQASRHGHHWEPLLDRWRERSFGVVSKTGLDKQWLAANSD